MLGAPGLDSETWESKDSTQPARGMNIVPSQV